MITKYINSECINNWLRRFYNMRIQNKLINKDFTVISSNCNGALICHDLNLRYNSPFVNLWMYPQDFIKYLEKIEYYMQIKPIFIKEQGIAYPIGLLDDIKIYFQHYESEEEAMRKWMERSKRINLNNMFVLMTDRDGCTYEDLKHFDGLAFKNKIVFTHVPYEKIKSSYYIRGFEKQNSVGMCSGFRNRFTWKKYYDDFPYVSWFNGELE